MCTTYLPTVHKERTMDRFKTSVAANFLGVDRTSLVRWRVAGEGPPYTQDEKGHHWYEREALEQYRAKNKHRWGSKKAKARDVLKKGEKRSLDEPMAFRLYPPGYDLLAAPEQGPGGIGQREFYDPKTGEWQINRSTDPRYGKVPGVKGGYHPLWLLQKSAALEDWWNAETDDE
jgi:hypothetical protein